MLRLAEQTCCIPGGHVDERHVPVRESKRAVQILDMIEQARNSGQSMRTKMQVENKRLEELDEIELNNSRMMR